MMTAHRCQTPGCGRFVRAGASFCKRHDERETEEPSTDASAEAHARFLELLERGEYADLFGDKLVKVMQQAAEAMAERGLTEEIGALRMVLSRLVKEEKDLSKLAASVTRVASVTVQAARTQRAINGDVAQGLTSALTQILAELDDG